MYCVNDAAVMQAWAQSQKTDGSMITMLADSRGELTGALGAELRAPAVLGNPRCKRFAMVVKDGEIASIHEDAEDGDGRPKASFAEQMLQAL